MTCPNCVLGELVFHMRAELRFSTDEKGRPCGEAEIRSTNDQYWASCELCNAIFGIDTWQSDGTAELSALEEVPEWYEGEGEDSGD